ncbi:hypothetical protein V7112_10585, partial [Bacillus sp. JJ1566]|uniref:hypothetical protein n=1 Tax=Bacillus sp. JJ1566 TaxID=3122961 RepID=UPI002FFE8F0D
MMKKSEWNDEQLEQMLSQMPTIKDNRKPQEIYQNISLKTNKRKKKVWIVPTIASVAAALLLFILAPSFITNMNSSSSDSAEMARDNTSIAINKEASKDEPSSTLQKAEEPNQDEEAGIFSSEEQSSQSYAVHSVGENEVLLTYGVYLGGVMFPSVVSIVVESDGENVVEQWQKNIPQVNEFIRQNAGLGIDEIPVSYFEDFSEITRKDGSKIIQADIAENVNPQHFASAEMSSFQIVLNSFRYLTENYQHVELYKDGKHGIPDGDWMIDENYDVEKDTKKAYLYYVNEESNFKILAQTYDNFDTIEEALEIMKIDFEQG